MSVTNIRGNDYELAVSPTVHDGATAETTSLHFPISSGNQFVPNEPTFYTDESMSHALAQGREVDPVPDRLRFSKSFGSDFYPELAAHQMAFCGGPGALINAVETFAGTGIYKHGWNGPRTNLANVASYTMEQSARPDTVDADYNLKNHNVATTQVVIQGSRDSRVVTISCDVIGGGDYTSAGAGGSGTETKSNFHTFMHAILVTSTNLGLAGGSASSGFTAAPTLAQAVTDSYLGGTPDADYTRAMHDFTLTLTQPINVDGSYTAGALDTGGSGNFGIVENNSMWIPAGPQDATLSFTLNENDTDGTTDVGALATEANLGTMRGWELWIVNPKNQSANGTAAYPGIKVSMPNCSAEPMSQSDNLSSNTRTFTYKPHFVSGSSTVFRVLTASKITADLIS